MTNNTEILITGGAGNIGSALSAFLVKKGYSVVVVDNLSTGKAENLKRVEITEFYKVNVNDKGALTKVFDAHQFKYVFHYAAVVGVQRTLDNPLDVFDDIKGIENILDLSKANSVERLFYASSSEVYGEPFEIPQNEETTPLNSKLPYAIVKNLGEAYCRAYQKEFGLEYTIFRFFNTYGPNQSTDFVIPRFVKKALKNEPIFLNGDGLQTRTFCHIDDNIETCFKTMTNPQFRNVVLNVGSAHEITILELAKIVKELTKSESDIRHAPALEEGDMTRRKPDNSKMIELLQRELISLEDGIKEIIAVNQ